MKIVQETTIKTKTTQEKNKKTITTIIIEKIVKFKERMVNSFLFL